MKKAIILLFLGILPVSAMYLFQIQNSDDASYKWEDARSIIAHSPFKEFTYMDYKALKLFKDNFSADEDVIGVYIGKHGSLAIIEKRKGFLDKYFKKDEDLVMKKINKLDLGTAEVNDLVNLLPNNYKDVIIYTNNSVIGVYYDLGTYRTYIVKIVRKNGDKINLEKIKNEFVGKVGVMDYNVEDIGDKVYIYLEYRGYISPADMLKMIQ